MFKLTTLGILPMILFLNWYGWTLAGFGTFILISGVVQLTRDIVLTVAASTRKDY